jgi:hypothetical protein
MRTAGRLFVGIALFFGLVAVVYWFMAKEPAGTAALVFTGGLGFLVAFYLLFTAKRVEPLPEDDDEGEIAEGAGVQGFFSPHSWSPLAVGLGSAITALGVAFLMWWMIILGAVAIVAASAYMLFEYYVGDFARE